MANTYLSKAGGTATDRRKFTISFWVKRGLLNTSMYFYETYNSGNPSNDRFLLAVSSANNFRVVNFNGGSADCEIVTNRVLRDVNAWYHIVVAIDTTQSTASNRVKIYINGVEETSFSTNNTFAENAYPESQSSSYPTNIGRYNQGAAYFDGSISHFNFIDGTQYQASAFGEYDANGVWKIKTSPSVTYGNNGYFILKDGNSVTDQSGNSNNFTVGGGTLTKTESSPSNVFNTLNPLDNYYGSSTLSNGNNTQNQSASAGNYAFIPSTLGFNSGKWYWEMKCVSGHSDNWYGTGITSNTAGGNNHWLGSFSNDYGMYGYSYGGGLGASYTGNTRTNQGLSFTAGDIIGVAVDCDNLAIYFSKNGTWMSNASSVQGVPTSGSSKTGSFFTITSPSSTTIGFYFPALCYYDAQTAVQQANFGNGYFGTTAVSSAGTNASGIGIFEYDVPTGFTALSTKGLNE